MREVRKRLPDIDLLYFADQAHVPYGDRTPDDLHRLLEENVRRMEALGATAIAMGCNTSCAIAAKLGWPDSAIPILDLIEAAAAYVAGTGAARVGVLATKATAASGAYGNAIRANAPRTSVAENGSSELVPLVEAGIVEGPEAEAAVGRAIAPFGELDAIVLACTHFPFLDAVFARALGADVERIDPAVAQAARSQEFAERAGLSRGTGRTHYVTTGPLGPFAAALSAIVTPHDTDAIESLVPVTAD